MSFDKPVLLQLLNTLRPRQYGCHFPDDILKRICLNENVSISLKISQKFFPKVQFNNIPALVQIMAWRRPGDKPLSEPMMVSLLTHICVTRPQWVKMILWLSYLHNEISYTKRMSSFFCNGHLGLFQHKKISWDSLYLVRQSLHKKCLRCYCLQCYNSGLKLTGPLFNIMIFFYQYRKSYCGEIKQP